MAQATDGLDYSWSNVSITVDIWSAVFTSSPSTTAIHGQIYTYSPTTSVSCSYQAEVLPAWMSFSGTTFSGTPLFPGKYEVACLATSYANLGMVTEWWNITVPTWSYPFTNAPNGTAADGVVYDYQPACSGPVIIAPIFLPNWLVYESGTLMGSPKVPGAYCCMLEAYAMDGEAWSYCNWTIDVNSWAYGFTTVPQLTLSATSSYSYVPGTNGPSVISVVSIPSWMTFSNGVLSGRPTSVHNVSVVLKAVSSDGMGTTEQQFEIDVIFYLPSSVSSPPTSVELGDNYSFAPEFNESVSISLINAPSWISFENGVVQGTTQQPGDYAMSVEATSIPGYYPGLHQLDRPCLATDEQHGRQLQSSGRWIGPRFEHELIDGMDHRAWVGSRACRGPHHLCPAQQTAPALKPFSLPLL